ncbi:MAG: tRNA uridine-5-carboxymethylaminomethyl(34) synthesis GTPase MnmE [Endomicrobium sp.]|jgi:tRNA modification GTPase|nr:tRNA uridine-5-carboxymethylaminomethyl(34) synthesis GTPase MnmE [Endomicrobium sp.]
MNYLKNDTIAALSTAAGKSAIAVVRLSGENAFEIINKVFKTKSAVGKQVKYGYIVDGTKNIDEVICTFFKAPHTYTGENLVEISMHGNPVIIDEVLNLLYKSGARPAESGEFTYKAFLNGKKDLAEAEAVCNLITSRTATSAKAALNNVSGVFSSKVKTIKDNLTNLIAFMEVTLDHPEEDVVFLSRKEKLTRLDSYVQDVKNLLSSYEIGKLLQNGIKAAIIGKPNAGKSSLLNAILGKNRAIVTDIAGTTRDTIEETVDCRGIPLTIIDTAGIRDHADNSIELMGQERTKETITKADFLLWVFDSSSNLDKNDIKIADFLKKSGINMPTIAVLNKSDLPVNLSLTKNSLGIVFQDTINISAKTEKGISDLLDKIAKTAGANETQNDYLMINSRHYALLQNALDALTKTRTALESKNADEIACFEAANAQNSLNEVLGINVNQDILDTIFSTFCIGK